MDKKKLVLLASALLIALITAFAARSMFSGAGAPATNALPAQPDDGRPRVLVATRSLPVGTIITPESFKYQPWPEELIKDAYFVEGQGPNTDFLGTVVRNPVTAGQPVTQGSLVNPGDRGFLAAALGPGMRAVTVPVSSRTAVAGFVFPGDRIDLLLTQAVKSPESDGEALKTSETIIRNLRVLATDQSPVSQTVNGKTVVRKFSSVTVEVTPTIAEKITVAQTLGTLSLALRSIADNQAELESAIASGDVNIPDNADSETEARILKTAMSRPTDRGATYTTGGDVSRFQRKNLAPNAQTKVAPDGTIVSGPPKPAVRVARGNTVSKVTIGGE